MKSARRFGDTITKRPYLSLAFLCLLVGLLFNRTEQCNIAALMAGGLIILLVFAIGIYMRGRLTHERLIILLVAAGVLLRMGYALYTPYTVRQHDVGMFGSEGGHAGYIEYIANHLALPGTNTPWQYYHPPLHHIISGLWLRLNLAVAVPAGAAYKSVQLLGAFYSCEAILVCYGIAKELMLSQRATAIVTGIVCFHPAFIILAGTINNDMLMILFFLTAMLFTLRWYRKPSMKNILCIAVFLGLAIMTKLSALILAPAIAFVFLVKLWRQRSQRKKMLSQFGMFCLISVPLGIWYPVRNLIVFRQPLFYVPQLGGAIQYIGNYSIADRLWNIPWSQLCSAYQNWKTGYNIPLSIIKTATFGESDFKIGASANILLYLNILLAVIAMCAMVWVLIKRDEERSVINWALGIAWITQVASYVKFCFDYPNICTQDFRYIVPTLLIGAVFIGQLLDRSRNGSRCKKSCARTIECVVILFCVFSAAVYVTLGMAH